MLVKGVPLRVIGVLVAKGQSTYGQDQDDLVMIPFTTAETKVLGVAAPTQTATTNAIFLPQPNPYGIQPRLTGFVNQIYVQAASPTRCRRRSRRSPRHLVRRHRIRPGDVNDFAVRNLSQIASAAEGSSQIMALLLAAVASISLLVGGIGIMNILLVSVTERTREIGLRMAIGARRLHVLLQFLAEAVLLSVVGGVAGIIVGVAASRDDLARRRLADPDLADRDRRRVRLLGRGRDLLRLLPGAQGGAARSDRGAALRVTRGEADRRACTQFGQCSSDPPTPGLGRIRRADVGDEEGSFAVTGRELEAQFPTRDTVLALICVNCRCAWPAHIPATDQRGRIVMTRRAGKSRPLPPS